MKKFSRIVGILFLAFILMSCEKDLPIEKDTFKVSFIVPEGMAKINDLEVISGETIVLPSLDDIGSYSWYEDSNYKVIFEVTKSITKNMTLYLKVDSFDTITYHSVDGDFEKNIFTVITNIYNVNEFVQPVPEIVGHTFVGWYIDLELTKPFETNPFVITQEAQNFNLYAKYEINSYTFKRILDGDIIDEYSILYNHPIIGFSVDVSEGLEFSGWYIDQALTIPFHMLYMPGEDLILYGESRIVATYESYTNIALMKQESEVGDFVEFTGIITSKFRNVVYVTDGTNAVEVYTYEFYETGTRLRVIGKFQQYKTFTKINNVIDIEIVEIGLENPLEVIESSIEDVIEKIDQGQDILGFQYMVTARLQYISGQHLGLIDEFDNALRLYIEIYPLFDNPYEEHMGSLMTMKVAVLSNERDQVILGYSGLFEEVTVLETKDDITCLADDVLWINKYVPPYIEFDLNVPPRGVNGSLITNLVWSPSEYISNKNYIIGDPENGLLMTLSMKLTKGNHSEDVTILMRYTQVFELKELIHLEEITYAAIEGYIYALTDDGFYIFDNYETGYIFVKMDHVNYDIKIGDFMGVSGKWDNKMLNDAHISLIFSFLEMPLIQGVTKTLEEVMIENLAYGTIVKVSAYVDYQSDKNQVWLRYEENDIEYLIINPSTNYLALIDYDGKYVNLTIIVDRDDKVLFIGEADEIEITIAPID